MIDIGSVAEMVKHNCNISDARYWGLYTPCGLLLRLRDLYRIEHKLQPWSPVGSGDIADWIGRREQLWQELELRDFQPVIIEGKKYSPFNVRDINAILVPHGYLYGAGYGNLMKPVFLLAEISEQVRKGRHTIFICGNEAARDLTTSFAMIQGNTIIAKRETLRFFYWDKYEEAQAGRRCASLSRAFSEYGMTQDEEFGLKMQRFSSMVSEEIAVYISHELGEASQRRFLGKWWKDLVAGLPYGRAELFLRGIKDLLSDTCGAGTLSYIIGNRKAASLSFYVSLLGGFRKTISPEIIDAYEAFMVSGDWAIVDRARVAGYEKALGHVRHLKSLCESTGMAAEGVETWVNDLLS